MTIGLLLRFQFPYRAGLKCYQITYAFEIKDAHSNIDEDMEENMKFIILKWTFHQSKGVTFSN